VPKRDIEVQQAAFLLQQAELGPLEQATLARLPTVVGLLSSCVSDHATALLQGLHISDLK
jgi:hypothetical protein